MTGTLSIRWVAHVAAATVVVLLGGCTGDRSSPPPPLTITAESPPPQGTAGVTYPTYTLMASGGQPEFSWTESGPLPPGLTLSRAGQLSGTPLIAGSYPVIFSVLDSSQPAQSAQISLNLVISDSPIVIAATPSPPNGIVTYPYPASGFSASPFGVQYPSYGFGFTASGGSPPYIWQASGMTPPGLVLSSDGVLSGTPTQVGSFAFTVSVKDSAAVAGTNSSSFTIDITSTPSPSIVNSEAPTGTAGVAYPAFQSSVNGGLAPFVWTENGALDGLALSSSGVLSGTPNATGKFPITLDVTDAQNRSAASVSLVLRVSLARSGTFLPTVGNLTIARSGHSATLLNTGKVLVAGGANAAADRSAELYDPVTELFTATGGMTQARIGQSATLLNVAAAADYGKVLIVGSAADTAELYDPASGVFAATGNLSQARNSPTATLLETGSAKLGSVLIVGGNTVVGDLSAELYNPATGTFNPTGSTGVLRVGHTATQLLDGRVLIAGGGTASAELYDPSSGSFGPTGSMTVARTGATATRLHDGTVLIFGAPEYSADIYDPRTGQFAPVGSYSLAAKGQTASLRPDGSVLAAGGYLEPYDQSVTAAALFGPESDGFTLTASLKTSRSLHTATVLADGSVLIVGGTEASCFYGCDDDIDITILSSAEIYK